MLVTPETSSKFCYLPNTLLESSDVLHVWKTMWLQQLHETVRELFSTHSKSQHSDLVAYISNNIRELLTDTSSANCLDYGLSIQETVQSCANMLIKQGRLPSLSVNGIETAWIFLLDCHQIVLSLGLSESELLTLCIAYVEGTCNCRKFYAQMATTQPPKKSVLEQAIVLAHKLNCKLEVLIMGCLFTKQYSNCFSATDSKQKNKKKNFAL